MPKCKTWLATANSNLFSTPRLKRCTTMSTLKLTLKTSVQVKTHINNIQRVWVPNMLGPRLSYSLRGRILWRPMGKHLNRVQESREMMEP